MTHARSALRWFIGSVGLVALAGCLDSPTGTNTQPTDVAVVQGVVTETGTGQPILGALVGIRIPTNRTPGGYIAPTANTNDAGTFQMGVYRVDSTVTKAATDTMTVWVIATLPGLPTQGHTDSVQTTLAFVPYSPTAQPQPANVSLQLSF